MARADGAAVISRDAGDERRCGATLVAMAFR
jgi:hypothetical protein